MNREFKGLNLFSLKITKAMIVVILILPSIAASKNFKVTLVPSSNSPVYINTINSIKETLGNNSGVSVTILSLAKLKHQGAPDPETDLYVSIGTQAFEETVTHKKNKAILATLIPESSFHRIKNNYNNLIKSNNLIIGAIFIDQPFDRLISLTNAIFSRTKHIGVLTDRNNPTFSRKISRILHDRKLPFRLEEVSDSNDIIPKLSELLDTIDVLVAHPDPLIFNNRSARMILLTTYRHRVPVIGFSKAYVKAGALASIYSTPELIGKQTGEFLLAKSKNNNISTLTSQHAKYFSIAINHQVARSLNLSDLQESIIFNLITDFEVNKE